MIKKFCDRCKKEIIDGDYLSLISLEDHRPASENCGRFELIRSLELCKDCRKSLSQFFACGGAKTNLEKLKAEIAEMSAEEFEKFLNGGEEGDVLCNFIRNCRSGSFRECHIKWLNSESEGE